ncbi:MAG: hypothetical protein NTW29_10635 [Bacteroidetes bacterium]|nr:hypothetical protein [Bacteroidota bacterium]
MKTTPLRSRHLLFSVLFTFFGFTAFSQQRYDAFINMNEKTVPGFTIVLPTEEKLVQQLLDKRLSAIENFKIKQDKNDFSKISKIQFLQISRDFIDLYFKIEPVIANDKKAIKLTMLISKGYDNFVNNTVDTTISDNMNQFLESFFSEIRYLNLLAEIENQQLILQQGQNTTISIKSGIQKMEQEVAALGNKISKAYSELNNQLAIESLESDKLNRLKIELQQLKEKFNLKTNNGIVSQ